MDNINEIIGSVLSDPDSMAKLKSAAEQLGLNAPEAPSQNPREVSDGLSALAPAINRLAPLLGKLGEEDDMTRLLHALKPYLSGARLKRAEEADRIVSIMRVIPLLRQSQQETQP